MNQLGLALRCFAKSRNITLLLPEIIFVKIQKTTFKNKIIWENICFSTFVSASL